MYCICIDGLTIFKDEENIKVFACFFEIKLANFESPSVTLFRDSISGILTSIYITFAMSNLKVVRHVTGNDQDYLRKIPRVVVQKSALL
jgi:hypothetical protein